ncbi:MAG: hypothetical protein ABIT71_23935 [Vicinamibacteraceae bacterium]
MARKKGDGRRRLQREDDAHAAYRDGLAGVEAVIALPELAAARAELPAPPLDPLSEAGRLVPEVVELLGTTGGLYQRLGDLPQALRSYGEGADLETRYGLPGTYNRLNALKLELLTGGRSLADLSPRLLALAEHIRLSLDKDKSLNDSGWVHADLGDCLALLGRTEEAGRAYATFIAKTELRSPERTLDVLKKIAKAMHGNADADTARLEQAIATLQGQLGTA